MPRPKPSTEYSSPVGRCNNCGEHVLWVMTDGARIPLDQTPPTYLLRVDERQEGLPVADRSRSYVVHTNVCRGVAI